VLDCLQGFFYQLSTVTVHHPTILPIPSLLVLFAHKQSFRTLANYFTDKL